MDLVLMPALLLFALFLGRRTIMLQGVPRMFVLFFHRRLVPNVESALTGNAESALTRNAESAFLMNLAVEDFASD